MKLSLNIVLLCILLVFYTQASAQSCRTENGATPFAPSIVAWHRTYSTDEPYREKASVAPTSNAAWYKYYSLAEASMDAGDTSTAIMYYHKAVYLKQADTTRYRQLQQLEKYYMIPERSFYLKSY